MKISNTDYFVKFDDKQIKMDLSTNCSKPLI